MEAPLDAHDIVRGRVDPDPPSRRDRSLPVETVVVTPLVFDQLRRLARFDEVKSTISTARSFSRPSRTAVKRYSSRCEGSRNASGSGESGLGSVQPLRSVRSRSRGARPLIRRMSRMTFASGRLSPSGASASTRSSDSTVRARPSGVQFEAIGRTVEFSTQTTRCAGGSNRRSVRRRRRATRRGQPAPAARPRPSRRRPPAKR